MVERPHAEDPRYLERLVEHLDYKMSSFGHDMEAVKRIVSSTPTKGDIIDISRAIKILDKRQDESWELLKTNARRIAYIATVAGTVAGICIKNANVQDLLPF